MSQFLEELKRRNVIRVAISYIVAAWLLIEVSATTFPMLRLPEWTATFVIVLLMIGFPIALIFAWAFELTPEGMKKEKDVDRAQSITQSTGRKLDFIIIGVFAFALVLFSVDKFVRVPVTAPASERDQEIVANEVQQSIAVLPFVNMSSDPEQEFFSDGLSEEILNLLAKIPDLKVIGRTSSFAFKGKNIDLRSIGEALGVKTLLEGSVRKAGDQVRITAQLIDTSNGAHIWSNTFNRSMTDIFALQDDVAAAIIDALQIHVGTNPSRGRPTENAEAYALFLKARKLYNEVQYRDAEEIALQAIDLDPNFAEAHELLAYVYWSYGGNSLNAAEAQKLMGEIAAKALAIDPGLVFARAMYQSGNLAIYSHLGELEALERAALEVPNNSWAKDALFFNLIAAGYVQEAIGVAERSVDLEPLSPSANNRLFGALYSAGRTDEAMATLEIVDQLRPNGSDWSFAIGHLVEGRDESAITHIEADLEQRGLPIDWVRELVTGARNSATGQTYLDRRIPQVVASMPEEDAYGWQQDLTYWYLYFGFLDRFFELILAGELTDSMWTDAQNRVNRGTIYRRLGFTAHPKYLEVAESIGIIDIWEQRGPPDFCEKFSGKWVCE